MVVLLDARASVSLLSVVLAAPETLVDPEALPDTVPEALTSVLEPDAFTSVLLLLTLVSAGVVAEALEVAVSVLCMALLALVAAGSASLSLLDVLVFVSTEQPTRAAARSALMPKRVRLLLLFMRCFSRGLS